MAEKRLIWVIIIAFLLFGLVLFPSSTMAAEGNKDLVDLSEFIPDLIVEIKYATTDNFTGIVLYESEKAKLRKPVAEKLKNAQRQFREMGYSLKVWDAYRPPEVQFKLWEIQPDARFLVNPTKGFSNHSRGTAIDVTLVDNNGNELPMPSEFDFFGKEANRDYSEVTPGKAANAKLLEKVMVKNGFTSIWNEWWHFDDAGSKQYPVIEKYEGSFNSYF
ncbi:MAG: M15 family metallopeptidase [Bacillota bacterium]